MAAEAARGRRRHRQKKQKPFASSLASFREKANTFVMLLALRRLRICNLPVATLRSRKQEPARGSMGAALGTPAAASADKRRSSTSCPPPPPIAASTTPSSLAPSPSSSSPAFRLLESPATNRALLPKKTPLGESRQTGERTENERRRANKEKTKKLNLDPRPFLWNPPPFPKKKKKRLAAPSHRPCRPRPGLRRQVGQRAHHHRRRRPRLHRGAQGAPGQAPVQAPSW